MDSNQLNTQNAMLDLAGNLLAFYENNEMQKPGILEMTGLSQHGLATLSGLNDHDYCNLSSISVGTNSLTQIRTVNKSSIPIEILEHFKNIKCYCTMGLFPEISRAWLAIDSEIYLWTFERCQDIAYYDGLTNIIVSVGLVRPKRGVFVEDIEYLLLLATPTEIVVLGVTFENIINNASTQKAGLNKNVYDGMQFMNKPIFVISTDNVTINVIHGTNDGRIFLGGKDGCLYEIYYQAESSWFGKRCKKVNLSQGIVSSMVPYVFKVFSDIDPLLRIGIDESRNLLYTLSLKGSIEAWDMATNYSTMRRFSKMTQSDILQCASNIVQTMDQGLLKSIKAICPVPYDDDEKIHLVAVTQSGVRLYFSTIDFKKSHHSKSHTHYMSPVYDKSIYNQHSPPQNGTKSPKPYGIFLLHVRLPPGFAPNATMYKPKQIHTAFLNYGNFLMVSTQQQEQDLLWSLNPTTFRNKSFLVESACIEELDGIVWSLSETRNQSNSKQSFNFHNNRVPTYVAVLTNQGTHVLAMKKPVNILSELLVMCNGPHHDAIKTFFQMQSHSEACISCLLVATSQENNDTRLSAWAAQAFMLYGGEPYANCNISSMKLPSTTNRGLLNSNAILSDRNHPQMYVSTPMPTSVVGTQTPLASPQSQCTINSIGKPQSLFPSGSSTVHDNVPIVYSARHDSLYLYVARMMKPFLKLICVDGNCHSNLNIGDCKMILTELYMLRLFLDEHSIHDMSTTLNITCNEQTNVFPTHVITNTPSINEQRNMAEQAHAEEKRSLTALNCFIKHTLEVFSLWDILLEHHFSDVIKQISSEKINVLKMCNFRELIISHSDICGMLILSLINSYLNDSASVDSISAKLRELCPNLYRHEDAVTYKATEVLMNAKNCSKKEEKNQLLHTALQMCKDAAPNLPLHNICQQFINTDYFEGVVELAAICASKSDPEKLGISYYNNDEPPDDHEGYACFAERMSCYKEVRTMLDFIYQTIYNEHSNQNQNGPAYLCSSASTSYLRSNEPSNAKISKIIGQALNIKDPLMHMTIYEWLLSHDMLSELLNLSEPSLGDFLQRNAERNPENFNLIDLLWKYYEKNGHHSKAAKILDNLATVRSNTISLDLRIQYLVRAIMCMRNESVGSSINSGIFLKELEDKLEIARVQKSIQNNLMNLANGTNEATSAINELNCILYDMTQLYQNFAEPFNLWECQLTILNCSHHNDPLLIESVWSNIINAAVEGTLSLEEKSTKLFSKIESLVQEFGESGHCFPFSFLIRELEIKACQLRLPEGTVPEKLISMGLDIELIMEYYSRMVSMNERVWTNEGNEWQLVESAIKIVTMIANSAHTIWYRSKRRIVGKAQDIIAVCLNICYQKPDTHCLQQRLKDLQSRLHRLINA